MIRTGSNRAERTMSSLGTPMIETMRLVAAEVG
jgi:hypothetical protein